MKILRVTLTILFFILAVFFIGTILMGPWPLYSFCIAVVCVSVIAAINKKGGSLIRIVALIVSGVFIIFGLLFIALVISTFFNNAYDNLTPVVLALLGLLGTATFYYLCKTKSL